MDWYKASSYPYLDYNPIESHLEKKKNSKFHQLVIGNSYKRFAWLNNLPMGLLWESTMDLANAAISMLEKLKWKWITLIINHCWVYPDTYIWEYYLISVPEAAVPSTRTFFWWNYGKKPNQLAVDIANLIYVYLFRFSIIMTMHDFPMKLASSWMSSH